MTGANDLDKPDKKKKKKRNKVKDQDGGVLNADA